MLSPSKSYWWQHHAMWILFLSREIGKLFRVDEILEGGKYWAILEENLLRGMLIRSIKVPLVSYHV